MTDDPKKNAQDDQDDLLLDHQYDEIQEYDNPMPRWWLYIFWASILFGVLYLLNVPGFGVGKGRIANYEQDVAEARARYGDMAAAVGEIGDGEILAILDDPARLAEGQTAFASTCSPCHKMDGGGSIGPNLTDPYWVHGKQPSEIMNTVANGVLDKGMPAWSATLKPAQLAALVAYVISLEGTNPPDPKRPEGIHADSAATASANE